jgi:pyridoxamine 5'-phosphate oxidase
MESLYTHTDYGQAALDESHLGQDPIAQLALWLVEAEQAGVYEPNAFVLGTIDAAGKPTARTVLLKGVDESGFFFATNYESRKGQALAVNPNVTMVFGWYAQHRQVVVEGVARKVEAAESDAYFATRPRDSQIATAASQQSQPIQDRAALEAEFQQTAERFASGDVPRPEHWGGYRIEPTRIEFWKGRSNRLHDRIVFERNSAGQPWQVTRLQP